MSKPMSDRELMRRFTVILFFFFWLACVYGLIASIQSTRHFLGAANKAPGIVVALNAGGSHPQIEFTNRRGERVSYPQGGLIFGYKVGDKVTVLYLENSPNPRARIDRIGALWDLSIFFALMVAAIPLMALVKLIGYKSKPKRESETWKISE